MLPTRSVGPGTGAAGRIQYLDVLRVGSMLSVVFLHTAAGSLRTGYGSSVWHVANLLTSFMSAAVPLFFMISGALLLHSPRTVSLEYTLKKRLPRVLIPFLAWSVLAVAYYLLVGWKAEGVLDWHAAADKLVHLPGRPTAIHLWFMYALIPLYILSPLIKKLIDSLSHGLAIYLLSIWVIFSSILPTLALFLPNSVRPLAVLDPRYDLSVMAGYAGYFVAGYYLMQEGVRVPKKVLTLVIIADTACIAVGTWWKTTAGGVYAEGFKTYTGLFVLILSVALFLLFKALLRERELKGTVGTAVRILAPLMFGVYLIHNLLVDLMARLIPWFPAGSVPELIGSYFVVLAASVAFVFVVSRIKGLSYVLGGSSN